ncbi:hydroxymethylbilane synthase [Planococcus sp. ISL-109]|uniref:hydroxymethylbilane synthase n=1 Tax=Planococcus sp. ISL-109 TaxID=2819166 RepID=UPI001BE8B405|nr:hydroxymethylbilane synthase [Planococcus sp. ISL-109]MBT2582443.1 hydroxymethylbilane synthase [Planococcus sp. ISL-109]
MRKIIVGSRRSKLALTQTNQFIDKLKAAGAPFEFEIKEIVTKGDRILDVQLSKVGGKGLFVKEIEQALGDQEIDFAVHSMKDMPAVLPEGFVIGCIPDREDPRDAYIANDHVKLMELPVGAVVGTSSLRRSSQLLLLRPDLDVQWIRGNIDTRLSKLRAGDFDAIILAAAGLKRMGWGDELVTEFMSTEDCLPAIGQGALAIECREDDAELLAELAKVNDKETELAVTAERKFLKDMNGSCQVPIAGYATISGDEISFTGLIAAPEGDQVYKESAAGTDPIEAGRIVAEKISAQGGYDLIQRVIAESNV